MKENITSQLFTLKIRKGRISTIIKQHHHSNLTITQHTPHILPP
jgi:hypothetical protein